MPENRQIRASKAAMVKAMEAIQACGLSVDSLQIEGAKVEIKILQVENKKSKVNSRGLKSWD